MVKERQNESENHTMVDKIVVRITKNRVDKKRARRRTGIHDDKNQARI